MKYISSNSIKVSPPPGQRHFFSFFRTGFGEELGEKVRFYIIFFFSLSLKKKKNNTTRAMEKSPTRKLFLWVPPPPTFPLSWAPQQLQVFKKPLGGGFF